MREEHVMGRCENIRIQLGDCPEYQNLLDEGLTYVYGKCANCTIRFYHLMKSADDLLVNFGSKYDTRGMKICKLLDILFQNCKDKKTTIKIKIPAFRK